MMKAFSGKIKAYNIIICIIRLRTGSTASKPRTKSEPARKTTTGLATTETT